MEEFVNPRAHPWTPSGGWDTAAVHRRNPAGLLEGKPGVERSEAQRYPWSTPQKLSAPRQGVPETGGHVASSFGCGTPSGVRLETTICLGYRSAALRSTPGYPLLSLRDKRGRARDPILGPSRTP